MGHQDEARPLYELVSELDPRDAESRERASAPPSPTTTVADVSGTPGVGDPASASSTKARRRDDADAGAPRNPGVSQRASQEGTAAMARGRLGDAERAFTRAVRADATNAVAVGGLAEVAFERARYSDALDYARRAAKLAPRNPKYLVEIGDAYFKLLRYDDALASYDRAAALAPRDPAIKSRRDRVRAKVQ